MCYSIPILEVDIELQPKPCGTPKPRRPAAGHDEVQPLHGGSSLDILELGISGENEEILP